MRTTVRLNDALLRETKAYARRHSQSLASVIDLGLRQLLKENKKTKKPGRIRLITCEGKGVMPGVDLDDTAALLDLMEDHDSH
ncbi:MAG: DUF2191 domain-containing protein [Deltaproteobacteria bacterium]|nr:DUF2191 domain-containing protein [Deltaproteobacteria bacterium]